ncbi:thioredoxin-like protein [Pleomassaria siparia CBS 279.74]|uniref:glutathione transferase n=1 Tax=Pleomassaria siparia CBS 279.74 TaxID=1314801 RepID=A0A6G1JUS8_9PLEO|nr:thioredoxin-like protein [Pleomassaria siparia CBS 279.74]
MVLKLYGSAMSTSRVLTTMLEKELPYEFIRVDIAKGEQKSEDYKKLQPFGKVPVLDDDGFIMYESRAICKYLARKYPSGKQLIPESDSAAFGRFEQACSIEQSYFAAAAETVGIELYIKPCMKGLCEPDMARVAQAEQDFDTVLGVYDKILARQKYLAAAMKAGKWNDTFVKYPNVDRWFKELQMRESWVKASAEAGTTR